MLEIPLTQGKIALIDDADFPIIASYKWRAIRGRPREDSWYAIAHTPMVNGKRHSIQMHRLIMNAPDGVKVDHRDFNGLNNQKLNLRLATDTESSRHTRKPVSNNSLPTSSKFKGVSFDKRHSNLKCQINFAGKQKWIGYFESEEKAARAYDLEAKNLFGEFAELNFVQAVILEPQKEE